MRDVEAQLGMPAAEAGERVLSTARRYVEVETPSRAVGAIIALSEMIEADLSAAGARIERRDAPGLGRNLLAHIDGSEPGLESVLVLAHIDTVHPVGTLAERPFRIEDGRAFAPGIYDMKSGLACVVEALTLMKERGIRPRRPVRLLVTCDEEIGSHSARKDIETEAHRAAAVLVPEPCLPDGGAKTFRKGVATYRVETTGRAAHAGVDAADPVSAITGLLHALRDILELAAPERGTTINVGTIGGGTASNVIAAEAWATVDVRLARDGEGERIHAAFSGLQPIHPRGGLEVRLTEARPPLLRSAAVAALYEQVRGLVAELGVHLSEGASGGGSDGSLAAATGAAVLDGLGPLGDGAHADHEHIVLSDLPFRLAFMARVLERL
ncbi:MAG TPA: M20/M25/M40 family metallo-hydrolase [Longimicrobiales bacterium]|nr:M20/M25/M40 family metallo-hydrolase [Longimicrobiales bacterium]